MTTQRFSSRKMVYRPQIQGTRQVNSSALILALILLVGGTYLVLESSTHKQTTASYILKIPLVGEVGGIVFDEVEFVDVSWSTKAVNRPYGIGSDLLDSLFGRIMESDFIIKLEASSDGQVIKTTTKPIKASSLELYHGSISIETPLDSSYVYTLKVFDASNNLLASVVM